MNDQHLHQQADAFTHRPPSQQLHRLRRTLIPATYTAVLAAAPIARPGVGLSAADSSSCKAYGRPRSCCAPDRDRQSGDGKRRRCGGSAPWASACLGGWRQRLWSGLSPSLPPAAGQVWAAKHAGPASRGRLLSPARLGETQGRHLKRSNWLARQPTALCRTSGGRQRSGPSGPAITNWDKACAALCTPQAPPSSATCTIEAASQCAMLPRAK